MKQYLVAIPMVIIFILLFTSVAVAEYSPSQAMYHLMKDYYSAEQYKLTIETGNDYCVVYPNGLELFDVYMLMADSYSQLFKYKEVIQTYKALLTDLPDNPNCGDVYTHLGDTYARIDDDINAIQIYIFIVENYSDTVYSDYATGQLLNIYGIVFN